MPYLSVATTIHVYTGSPLLPKKTTTKTHTQISCSMLFFFNRFQINLLFTQYLQPICDWPLYCTVVMLGYENVCEYSNNNNCNPVSAIFYCPNIPITDTTCGLPVYLGSMQNQVLKFN